VKAGTCVSAVGSFARHLLMVTKYTVTVAFDGAFGDISMIRTF
jgi:hypothetical protein